MSSEMNNYLIEYLPLLLETNERQDINILCNISRVNRYHDETIFYNGRYDIS